MLTVDEWMALVEAKKMTAEAEINILKEGFKVIGNFETIPGNIGALVPTFEKLMNLKQQGFNNIIKSGLVTGTIASYNHPKLKKKILKLAEYTSNSYEKMKIF